MLVDDEFILEAAQPGACVRGRLVASELDDVRRLLEKPRRKKGRSNLIEAV